MAGSATCCGGVATRRWALGDAAFAAHEIAQRICIEREAHHETLAASSGAPARNVSAVGKSGAESASARTASGHVASVARCTKSATSWPATANSCPRPTECVGRRDEDRIQRVGGRSDHNRCTIGAKFDSALSKHPSGVCPAFLAISSTKQSENPSAGRRLKCASAATTVSAS